MEEARLPGHGAPVGRDSAGLYHVWLEKRPFPAHGGMVAKRSCLIIRILQTGFWGIFPLRPVIAGLDDFLLPFIIA